MPSDALSLAVFVGCEIEDIRLREHLLELGDLRLLLRVDEIERLEVLLYVNAQAAKARLQFLRDVFASRDVADVTYRRFDHEIRAEIAPNGLRFRGRLDDDQ